MKNNRYIYPPSPSLSLLHTFTPNHFTLSKTTRYERAQNTGVFKSRISLSKVLNCSFTSFMLTSLLAWIKALFSQSCPAPTEVRSSIGTGTNLYSYRLPEQWAESVFFLPCCLSPPDNRGNSSLNKKDNQLPLFRGLHHQVIDLLLPFGKALLQAQQESVILITKTKFLANNHLLTLRN